MKIIGADIPLNPDRYAIVKLLNAFKEASEIKDNIKLILTGRRDSTSKFSIFNFLDKNDLLGKVEFLPYFSTPDAFPLKKLSCDAWIDRDTPESVISKDYILNLLENKNNTYYKKKALFVTSFHPLKMEGNSALMRQWIDQIKKNDYDVHVLYYAIDRNTITQEITEKSYNIYDYYKEVNVESAAVGHNANGLNVHVDDWCGNELMDEVIRLVQGNEYDIALVNYAFTSAVFDKVASYTKRILLTHDSFADRNRRMLAQGYPESSWVSIDIRGEQLACRRADIVVALQDEEAAHFQALAGDGAEVLVVGPIPTARPLRAPPPGNKLRVGYMGSGNYVNEHNLIAFLQAWVDRPGLSERAELLVAGGASLSLHYYASHDLLSAASPRLLGKIDDVGQFFEMCDIIINPERGGTGIKIKTLEAMAHGCAVATTAAGSVGIGSLSRFHNAEDSRALVSLIEEIAGSPELLDAAANETRSVYASYLERHKSAMRNLLASNSSMNRSVFLVRPNGVSPPELIIPEYVAKTAAQYQLNEFRKFFDRIDVRGKHVLEVGSDFHLVTARLFAANGAASVTATNIGDWRSDEPLPDNVKFVVGDVANVELPEAGFDIIYGIAIIEHIPDMDLTAQALRRALRPGGIGYIQGYPLWPGRVGHHIWLSKQQIAIAEKREPSADEGPNDAAYSFTDTNLNPIPDWAHLTHKPAQLKKRLIEGGMPRLHAEEAIRWIFNVDGLSTGSCSNFLSASQILSAVQKTFSIEFNPITETNPESSEFKKALSQHSEFDLTTSGLEIWLSDTPDNLPSARSSNPIVSVIIPFFNVEEYVEECVRSVATQNLQNIEIILVDDASKDGTRLICERLASEDARIRVITHKANRGLGPARNTGVEHARGAYIFFLDSDDKLSRTDALSLLVKRAQDGGHDVVVGSCERLNVDGTISEFDREHDRNRGGVPGRVVPSLDAFVGAVGLPGATYIPMRAWGMLIEHARYSSLALEFPPGEHEDMAHTPFLYLKAASVFYDPTVIVQYRLRPGSLSTAGWSVEKIRRYQNLWRETVARIRRFAIPEQLGNFAALHAWHLIWRIGENGISEHAEAEFKLVLSEMLLDARSASNLEMTLNLIKLLQTSPLTASEGLAMRILSSQSISVQLAFHRRHLGLPEQAPTKAAEHQPSQAVRDVAATHRQVPDASDFQQNEQRVLQIFSAYDNSASETIKSFPAMLTYGDRALYFWAGQNYSFSGSIVDGGCFVGGTTTALLEGLQINPLLISNRDKTKIVRVYDLFQIDDDYIRFHLTQNYPGRDFSKETSFLPVFRENMAKYESLIDVRPGDVTKIGYPDSDDIEIMGVDFCKALEITDFTVRTFFPRLMPNALVIQQDFIHEFHPHIHLSMMKLRDHFEKTVELRWGGSVGFTCTKPITSAVVRSRFGADCSWYNEIDKNVGLLRELIDWSLYDENKWTLLLTLGWYYISLGKTAEARAAYREARALCPHLEPNELTRQRIGGE